jgi:hypothetical protein
MTTVSDAHLDLVRPRLESAIDAGFAAAPQLEQLIPVEREPTSLARPESGEWTETALEGGGVLRLRERSRHRDGRRSGPAELVIESAHRLTLLRRQLHRPPVEEVTEWARQARRLECERALRSLCSKPFEVCNAVDCVEWRLSKLVAPRRRLFRLVRFHGCIDLGPEVHLPQNGTAFVQSIDAASWGIGLPADDIRGLLLEVGRAPVAFRSGDLRRSVRRVGPDVELAIDTSLRVALAPRRGALLLHR